MASRADVETRLRGYAQEYDSEFPSTARVEGRIMARISITPRDLRAARVMRPRRSLAGVLVRQLAMVCVLLIGVGVLVLGVSKLRAVQRHNVPSVGAPGKLDVYFSAMQFVSASEGWIAESRSSQSLAGPTVLFRTIDGGRTWQRQLTWDGPGPEQIRFSADGKDGLVVGRGGVPIFRTADGGVSWDRMSPPPEASQVALLYFLDAREGWLIAYLNETTPGFAGVFHTTDGGQTWTRTARIDVNQVFSYGPGGSLQGSLMFRDSSTGWFKGAAYSGTNIPVVAPHMFVTHDGGRTWAVQNLPTTPEAALDSSNASISLPQFFNQLQGVLLVTKFSVGSSSPPAPALQRTYIYTTVDGGDHWSGPQPLALSGPTTFLRALTAVDAGHWFVLSDSGLARTTDGGKHWTTIGGWQSNERVSDFEFENAEIGWAEVVAAGAQPTLAIYRTTDGGAHWTRFGAPSLS
jgi:photosystem II stability/assembly factor-like uncharacterized protein